MKLDMMTEQECYLCTVMHLSYFRKEANVIYVTLLDAPPRNDDMSGRYLLDFVFLSLSTPKKMETKGTFIFMCTSKRMTQ